MSRSELLRKSIHMAVGGGAFAVVFLGPALSALLAFAFLLFNVFVWPRIGGRSVWREGDVRRGFAIGIVFYPLVLLLLVLVFWHRLEVVAAIWAILAFGDGMAAVVGQALGGARWLGAGLPWNPEKSWAGSFAFWLFGALGSTAALWWTLAHQGRQPSPGFLAAAALSTALVAALVEAQPVKLDDNLTVPCLSAGFLWGVLQTESFWATADARSMLTAAGESAAITLVLAVAALASRAIDVSGALAGVLIGTTIHMFLGWRGLAILATFVALGTAATRLGFRRKAAMGLAQGTGGRRGAGHAVANAGVPAVLAVFAATAPDASAYLAAFAGAFAAAASDTSSSEIGQLRGERTVLITTWEPVPPGTDGGVSLSGTVAGLAGGFVIAVLGWALRFYPVPVIAWVTLAGLLGSLADSLAGATLERRGLLNNHAVNALNTLVGALAAAGLVLFSR